MNKLKLLGTTFWSFLAGSSFIVMVSSWSNLPILAILSGIVTFLSAILVIGYIGGKL